MISYLMQVRKCLEEIWIIRICMCISCLYVFPSCYAILHSLPAIFKIYYTSNSISFFSFIHLAFCSFLLCYPIYFWLVLHERFCFEGTYNAIHFVKDRTDSFRVFLITIINDEEFLA